MNMIDRRALLSALGVSAITTLFPRVTEADVSNASLPPVLVPPGGNRFSYKVDLAAKSAPCKLTTVDSGGAFSAFENVTPPKEGPPLHRHHREDEWFYVASGRFIFEIDGKRTEFGQGGSVFAPRGVTHRWANSGTDIAVMVLVLAPGGFETFFDDVTQAIVKMGHVPHDELKAIYARHGVDLLGPKIYE
jgi:mannose-6-phosphate isomerase-like protein (cupin superfamily)